MNLNWNNNFIIIVISIVTLLNTTSCTTKKTKVSLLVSSTYLNNIDSIKTQTPYKKINLVHDFNLSNLPTKLNNKRNHGPNKSAAWDEVVDNYKIESSVGIDTINYSKIIITRSVYKWLFKNNKRIKNRVNVNDLKQILISENIKPTEYKILEIKELEYDGGIKQTFLELRYKGTVNQIRLAKGEIYVQTYLISQIPYLESQEGVQFSTTTPETIEEYKKKKR